MTSYAAELGRHRLAERLSRAADELDDPAAPVVVVDLDTFETNRSDLVRRAAGTPIRLASKSVRVPALLEHALADPGFSGVLAYQLREALWLVAEGITDDAVMGYPSTDRPALARLAADDRARAGVTLMVDDLAQLDLLDAVRVGGHGGHGWHDGEVRVAIDIDAGLRLPTGSVGPKRSPLFEVADVLALAREVVARPGVRLVGAMTYEGQVAGVPDSVPDQRARSAIIRRLKQASVTQLNERRAAIGAALREVAELEFFNAGGSGSIETSAADPVVTEVSAGSGLLVPGLFDHYRSFTPRPAAYFGVPVVRRPGPGVVTVAGGGFIASGPAGDDRLPTPWAPAGLQLTGLEGAGEVQTPLTGPGTASLSIGDWVWFRHAKAGELAEHTNTVHLLRGAGIASSVPSYRGLGHAWG